MLVVVRHPRRHSDFHSVFSTHTQTLTDTQDVDNDKRTHHQHRMHCHCHRFSKYVQFRIKCAQRCVCVSDAYTQKPTTAEERKTIFYSSRPFHFGCIANIYAATTTMTRFFATAREQVLRSMVLYLCVLCAVWWDTPHESWQPNQATRIIIFRMHTESFSYFLFYILFYFSLLLFQIHTPIHTTYICICIYVVYMHIVMQRVAHIWPSANAPGRTHFPMYIRYYR